MILVGGLLLGFVWMGACVSIIALHEEELTKLPVENDEVPEREIDRFDV